MAARPRSVATALIAGTGKHARSFRPADQRFGIETRFEVFVADRQVFVEIEFRAEFGDQRLPLQNFSARGSGLQPFRQAVFAHGQARGGQQLEQAAAAK